MVINVLYISFKGDVNESQFAHDISPTLLKRLEWLIVSTIISMPKCEYITLIQKQKQTRETGKGLEG